MSGISSIKYSFSGKRVLVTGGGQGIGRELISRLHQDGAQVFTLEKNPDLIAKLKADFPNIRAETCDITNWNDVQSKVESFGPVHHLVNNAGNLIPHDLLNVTEQIVDFTMNINLKSIIAVSQAVAKGMIAENLKGTIVNVASIGAHMAAPNSSVYCATKAGVLMLTKCLARELGPYGIRCNSISPAGVNTPMSARIRKELPPSDSAVAFNSRQPLEGKKRLEPEEVVDGIIFLLSPLSSMATGTDLLLDGGLMAC